jgi:hypothetical protein
MEELGGGTYRCMCRGRGRQERNTTIEITNSGAEGVGENNEQGICPICSNEDENKCD